MGLFKRSQGEVGQAAHAELKQLTGEEFDALVSKSEVPAVVDFWAEWCGPCHMISPLVEKLATEFTDRAIVAKLNTDEHPEILGRYGIIGIPTVIYFKGGREVARVVGVAGYGTLKSKLERLLG